MARIDIVSFQKGIELKKSQIKKLENQIRHLQKKIDNTIECPKCKTHWDALYVKKTFWQKGDVWENYLTYQDESQYAVCICPLCKEEFTQLIRTCQKTLLSNDEIQVGKFDIQLCNESELVQVKDMFEKWVVKSQNGQTESNMLTNPLKPNSKRV